MRLTTYTCPRCRFGGSAYCETADCIYAADNRAELFGLAARVAETLRGPTSPIARALRLLQQDAEARPTPGRRCQWCERLAMRCDTNPCYERRRAEWLRDPVGPMPEPDDAHLVPADYDERPECYPHISEA